MANNGETYTTGEAARVLGVSPQRIRKLIQEGRLEAAHDEDSGQWRISQRAVHARLEEHPRGNTPTAVGADQVVADRARLREMNEEIQRLSREVGRLEGQREITQVAESTLREALDRERERADRLEAELREARRSWWSRLFGGGAGAGVIVAYPIAPASIKAAVILHLTGGDRAARVGVAAAIAYLTTSYHA